MSVSVSQTQEVCGKPSSNFGVKNVKNLVYLISISKSFLLITGIYDILVSLLHLFIFLLFFYFNFSIIFFGLALQNIQVAPILKSTPNFKPVFTNIICTGIQLTRSSYCRFHGFVP